MCMKQKPVYRNSWSSWNKGKLSSSAVEIDPWRSYAPIPAEGRHGQSVFVRNWPR